MCPSAPIHRCPQERGRPLCHDGGCLPCPTRRQWWPGEGESDFSGGAAGALRISSGDAGFHLAACGGGRGPAGAVCRPRFGRRASGRFCWNGQAHRRGCRTWRPSGRAGTWTRSPTFSLGKGGAGTFSDGKLTTGTHDPRLSQVMKTFVAAGALRISFGNISPMGNRPPPPSGPPAPGGDFSRRRRDPVWTSPGGPLPVGPCVAGDRRGRGEYHPPCPAMP